jgi:nitrate/nitrite transport system substrate-binding protein
MNGRQGCAGLLLAALSLPALALGAPEQEELRLGFIKLTDTRRWRWPMSGLFRG